MLNEEECNEWGRQQRRRKRTFHFGLFVLVFNEKFSFFTPCVLYTSCPFINSFFHSFEHRTFGETKTKTKQNEKSSVESEFCCCCLFVFFRSIHFISFHRFVFFCCHFPIIFFFEKIVENIFFVSNLFVCCLFADFFFSLSKVDHQKGHKNKNKKYSNLLSSSLLFLKAKEILWI